MAGMDVSSLFTSTSSTSSTQNYGIDLGEYALIKNGTYHKLTKSYYAQQTADEAEEQTDTKQSLTMMKTDADNLKSAADNLTSRSLWKQKETETTDETTGEKTTTMDYDRDAIYDAVKSFVDEYNAMIEAAGDAETKGVLRAATRMVSTTNTESKLLNEVGITIGSDNKLSVDEDKLKEASIGTLKTLFEGSGSYADQIAQKAGVIGRSASSATDTYTSSGTYTGTSSVSASTKSSTSSKAMYQLSDEMQSAILEQVKLDYYMYGGNTTGKTDSSSYTRKMESYLDSLSSENQSSAKSSITKFRDELSDLVGKAIKAKDTDWSVGDTVDTSVLNQVFKQEDELLSKAAANVYGNSFSQTV